MILWIIFAGVDAKSHKEVIGPPKMQKEGREYCIWKWWAFVLLGQLSHHDNCDITADTFRASEQSTP